MRRRQKNSCFNLRILSYALKDDIADGIEFKIAGISIQLFFFATFPSHKKEGGFLKNAHTHMRVWWWCLIQFYHSIVLMRDEREDENHLKEN